MKLRIDGVDVSAHEGETILDAARSAGIDIPVLCHSAGLDPVGVCRMCVVDVGERVLAAACVRTCEAGMEVRTHSEELDRHRGMLTELLMSDQPAPPESDLRETSLGDNELMSLSRRYRASGSSFPSTRTRGSDTTSKVIEVDHQACILCDRCVRACNDDIQIERCDRPQRQGLLTARIAFDLEQPHGRQHLRVLR